MKSDMQLKQDVLDELKWEPSVKEGGIAVSTSNGIVTLSGAVDSFTEKTAAEKATKRVAGVQAVANEVEVKLPFSSVKTDEEIARAALTSFGWNASIPPERFQVIVEGATVTLEGTADWNYQKAAAERIVRNLKGVRNVRNKIMLKPQISDREVKSKIEAALKRHAEVEAKKISIITSGDQVTLRGEVASFSEKDAAETAAWSAPGVRIVRDEIRVNR